jgi:Flp pilus assembly protein TadG
MKRIWSPTGRRREQGVVAVEAALVLPVLVLFLIFPSLYYALYFRQYSAAQKAVHDAALYLATASKVETTTSGPDGNLAALTVAAKIVEREMAGIVSDNVHVDPDIFCAYLVAGSPMTRPCTITYSKNPAYVLNEFDVGIGFNYVNPFTGSETDSLIAPYAVVRYVGN